MGNVGTRILGGVLGSMRSFCSRMQHVEWE